MRDNIEERKREMVRVINEKKIIREIMRGEERLSNSETMSETLKTLLFALYYCVFVLPINNFKFSLKLFYFLSLKGTAIDIKCCYLELLI